MATYSAIAYSAKKEIYIRFAPVTNIITAGDGGQTYRGSVLVCNDVKLSGIAAILPLLTPY
jgi:hypothetical protein